MSSGLEEAGHADWSWEGNERRLTETRRWMDAQHAQACQVQERQERRMLGFIPGDLCELWPTLLVASVLGALGSGMGELLVHHIDLVAACRHLG